MANDWRIDTIDRVRELVLAAVPQAVEERKWAKKANPDGVPVWSDNGILCTGETYKAHVKVTFFQGASLPDPTGLFNADDTGATRRAIDLREGDELDAAAFTALVQAAAEHNAAANQR